MPKPKPRKMGDPSGQPVTAFRGTSADQLRVDHLAAKTAAGQAGRVVSYNSDAVRAALLAQICPFCGAGPYKVVASHVASSHGIDRIELRSLAGLLAGDSICSPETAEKHRRLAVERDFGHRERSFETAPRKSARYTKVGKQRNVAASQEAARRHASAAAQKRSDLAAEFTRRGATVQAMWEMAEERGTTRNHMRKQLKAAGCVFPRAQVDRVNTTKEKDRQVMVTLYRSGLTQAQIAQEFGVTQTCVSGVLRRMGVSTRGSGDYERKVNDAQRQEIVDLYGSGLLQREIGVRYGISQTRVGQIVRQRAAKANELHDDRLT